MKYLWLIIILFSFKNYSQEILTKEEIYSKDNLIYKTKDNNLFTGKIQSFKNKTHLVFEVEFENGVLKKNIMYYNRKEKVVSEETYYYGNNRQVEKKISYSSDHKRLWFKYFDEFGNKKLEEEFNDGILTYRCPYLKNKKNGIVFSINEKGEKNECKFENGKLIKN